METNLSLIHRAANNFLNYDYNVKVKLAEIAIYKDLYRKWVSSNYGSNVSKKLAKKMIELNKTCCDYDELVSRRININHRLNIAKKIEARMIELNKTCYSYNELSKRLKKDETFGRPYIKRQIVARMIELNNIQLSEITDYDELVSRLRNLGPIIHVKRQIVARMKELLNKDKFLLINFFEKSRKNIPKFLEKHLVYIAKSIVKSPRHQK